MQLKDAVDSSQNQPAPNDLVNRELSSLAFNSRVLHEAIDSRNPLLERLRFLVIFSANIDEFFMKRVGGLKRQVVAGVLAKSTDGMTTLEQLKAIRREVLGLLAKQAECFEDSLLPMLRSEGIYLLDREEWSESDRAYLDRYFDRNVLPVLTPLAVDPGHPFPFLSNLSLSWGVSLRYPDSDEKFFARVKVPKVLPQWVELPKHSNELRFVRLSDVIESNLGKVFPEMVIVETMLFRITRNTDIEREEEDAEDLLEMIEDELRRRRFANVIRLEHAPDADPWMLQFLMRELELGDDDLYEMPSELDFTTLSVVADLNISRLKFDSWAPVVPAVLADEDVNFFNLIQSGDIFVHHPYESFGASVERFVRQAVEDKRVLAIKMTLYRTGDDSPFIPLLVRASELGKQVVCLVELKAYSDEERNIQWAQALEEAGVHVVYGIVGLKTHAKTVLVVRQESSGVRCYAHIGTGNYHSQTSKYYTDCGLFTCDEQIADDLVGLFHFLTGRSLKRDYEKLLIAPINMRERFLERIEGEIEAHRRGDPSGIIAKMNSLEDIVICRALQKASSAGVKIDLIVRGVCCLAPGVPGVSENIRVYSVLGRFLEHSRLFYFRNGQADPLDGVFLLGSADWMQRNLSRRVEVAVPITSRVLKERCWEILQVMLQDERQLWEMMPDGSYLQRRPSSPEKSLGSQQVLMLLAQQRAAIAIAGS